MSGEDEQAWPADEPPPDGPKVGDLVRVQMVGRVEFTDGNGVLVRIQVGQAVWAERATAVVVKRAGT